MATTVHPTTAKILAALKARFLDLKARSMRDAFAAAALPGLLASGQYTGSDESRIARAAYSIADALMVARGGKEAP